MRLQTVTEFGDFTAVLAPAIGVSRTYDVSCDKRSGRQRRPRGHQHGTSTMMTDVGGLTGSNFFMSSETTRSQRRSWQKRPRLRRSG